MDSSYITAVTSANNYDTINYGLYFFKVYDGVKVKKIKVCYY